MVQRMALSRHASTPRVCCDVVVECLPLGLKGCLLRRTSENTSSIAVCNGIEPSLCRRSDGTVSYATTQPIHARGRCSEEWVNCTDYRYRNCLIIRNSS